MTGNVMNGRPGSSEATRYVYLHFAGGGVAFHAKKGANHTGLSGSSSEEAAKRDILLSSFATQGGDGRVLGAVETEELFNIVSLMSKGWPSYWVGTEEDGYPSVIVNPDSGQVYYQGEVIHTNSSALMAALYTEPNEDGTSSREMIWVVQGYSGYLGAWSGYGGIEAVSIDLVTKEKKTLWKYPSLEVGVWGGSHVSINPKGDSVASVVTPTYEAIAGGQHPTPFICEISREGVVAKRASPAPQTYTEFAYADASSSSGTGSYTVAEFDWATVGLAVYGKTKYISHYEHSGSSSGIRDRHGTSTSAYSGPYACQYGFDGELLIATVNHTGGTSEYKTSTTSASSSSRTYTLPSGDTTQSYQYEASSVGGWSGEPGAVTVNIPNVGTISLGLSSFSSISTASATRNLTGGSSSSSYASVSESQEGSIIALDMRLGYCVVGRWHQHNTVGGGRQVGGHSSSAERRILGEVENYDRVPFSNQWDSYYDTETHSSDENPTNVSGGDISKPVGTYPFSSSYSSGGEVLRFNQAPLSIDYSASPAHKFLTIPHWADVEFSRYNRASHLVVKGGVAAVSVPTMTSLIYASQRFGAALSNYRDSIHKLRIALRPDGEIGGSLVSEAQWRSAVDSALNMVVSDVTNVTSMRPV